MPRSIESVWQPRRYPALQCSGDSQARQKFRRAKFAAQEGRALRREPRHRYVEQVEGEKGRLGHCKDGAHIIFRDLNLDGIRHLIVRAGCLDTKGAKLELRKDSPDGALLAIGLASFCSDLTLSGAWGACMDVGGRHTCVLSFTTGSSARMGRGSVLRSGRVRRSRATRRAARSRRGAN